MKLVITGGHHTSAMPVIQKLKKERSDVEICWIGHKRSQQGNKTDTLEYIEVTSLDIPFYNLHAGKVYKTFNIFRILKVPFGFIQAFFILLKIKPDVILSFGGYLAAPVVISGWLLGIPSVTHEQTVVVGYANKLISYFAKKVLISWKDSEKYFPAKKVVFTGIPLRPSIFENKSSKFLSDNDLPFIYITAGKAGSHIINEVVKECLSELLSFYNVIHQTGDSSVYKDFETLSELYSQISHMCKGNYFPAKFILEDEIGEALNKASIVVGRSGAHTISELLALNKPSLLIPIPWVSHNEQFLNAKVLESKGLSKILEQKDLTPQSLVLQIKNMFANLSSYKLPENEIGFYKQNNSADLIINEVFSILK